MNYLREFDLEYEGNCIQVGVISWDATEARGEWDVVIIDGPFVISPSEVPEDLAQYIEEEIQDHFKGATYHD